MKIKDIYVIKKDGTKQSFDGEKIVRAINASAKRIGETLSAEDEERTVELVLKNIHEAEVPILTMHSLVEDALDEVNPKGCKMLPGLQKLQNRYGPDVSRSKRGG